LEQVSRGYVVGFTCTCSQRNIERVADPLASRSSDGRRQPLPSPEPITDRPSTFIAGEFPGCSPRVLTPSSVLNRGLINRCDEGGDLCPRTAARESRYEASGNLGGCLVMGEDCVACGLAIGVEADQHSLWCQRGDLYGLVDKVTEKPSALVNAGV